MDDLISRQAAIDKADSLYRDTKNDECYMITGYNHAISDIRAILKSLPSAEPEPHYCRECKWSWCHINVDKHGKSEIYWRCLNWDGETDEEGYCHEWERRTDG